jgi:hypothetical protein
MSLIKRITILAALAAMTAGMSGCGPDYFNWLLGRMTDCAHGETAGTEEACNIGARGAPPEPDPEAEPSPPVVEPSPPVVEPTAAAAGRRGEQFRARFTGKPLGPIVALKRPGGAVISNLVPRGRFRVSFRGNSRLGRRFSSGRWTLRGDLNYKIRSRKLTGDAYMLLRFKRRGTGSLCLSVRGHARGIKNRKVQVRGSFVALGGTGEGAKLVGSGSFSQLSGRSSAGLRGRGRLRIGTTRPLPALCAALAQMR